MYYLGIDVGSLSCDAVLIDEQRSVAAWAIVPTGVRNTKAIAHARGAVLNQAGIEDAAIASVVSTGYGRDRVEGRDGAITEITCHARGIRELFPETRVLIDIGGQDSKAISLGPNGNVLDFAMNDKCAAGTGRFLEAMARVLEVDIDALGDLGERAVGDLTLSSMCTVFAESEVISLIARGTDRKEIARGLHRAVAARTASLVRRVSRNERNLPVAMTGGVARNRGVVNAISETLCLDGILIPEVPDIVGALGAALIALDRSA